MHFSFRHIKYTVVKLWKFVKNSLHTTRLGISEEHLTETVATNQGNQLLDAQNIQLVKNIVKKQDWLLSQIVIHILELS